MQTENKQGDPEKQAENYLVICFSWLRMGDYIWQRFCLINQVHFHGHLQMVTEKYSTHHMRTGVMYCTPKEILVPSMIGMDGMSIVEINYGNYITKTVCLRYSYAMGYHTFSQGLNSYLKYELFLK